MRESIVITKRRLIAELRQLGIEAGQTVMLHASVKAIGWVVGGPEVVLQSIFDILTPAGTLLMLVSWEDSTYEMPNWPPDKQQAYLRECPPFDPKRSRAYRGWGILAEYLRTWPNSCRSANPDESFAAVGRLAAWITSHHSLQYGLGPASPLAKLCQAGGKVLVLGSPIHHVTLIHYAEHMARIPNKPLYRYKVPILEEGRRKWVDIEEYDTNKPIGGWSGEDYFKIIIREALAAGIGHHCHVGAADAYLYDAEQLQKFAVAWLEAHVKGKHR